MYLGNQDLGFILESGEVFLRAIGDEEGHIEIAERIIQQKGWSNEFASGCWGNNPVDFLIYEKGALKVGNRWGSRKVSYYPAKLSREVRDFIDEYRARNYEIEAVTLPGGIQSPTRYFHC